MLSAITNQRGAGTAIIYIGLSVLVVAGALIAFVALRDNQQENAPDGELLVDSEQSAVMAQNAEPPEVKTVDLQNTEITAPSSGNASQVAKATEKTVAASTRQGDSLFDRPSGRVRPLQDGMTGGRESASTKDSPAPTPMPNAVDAFDFGVLDGRVRIGVFGKSPIEDYRVKVDAQRYIIQMPGQYRYVEDFSRRLDIAQFGVISAQLMRDARGMRMLIEVSEQLRHEPFLIEDAKGLMVAFEPKRGLPPR